MNDKYLPGEDHVCRYCKPKTVPDGKPTGNCFMLREGIDDFLSVNWLEYFGRIDRTAQLTRVREHIRLKGLSPNARFAILNIDQVIDYVSKESLDNRLLSVLHEPGGPDPSHAGIYGYGPEDELIADLIAQNVVDVQPAREPE